MRVEALSGVIPLLVRGPSRRVLSSERGHRGVDLVEAGIVSERWHWGSLDVEGPLHQEEAEEESLDSVVEGAVALAVVVGRDLNNPQVSNLFRCCAASLL